MVFDRKNRSINVFSVSIGNSGSGSVLALPLGRSIVIAKIAIQKGRIAKIAIQKGRIIFSFWQ